MVFGIYCRKSVLSDKGESVENQMEMCRAYVINKFGENNEFILYEDEGYSGKNTSRPMFIKLTEDIKKKKLDYVVCYRLDRMSRSVSDFSSLVEMMNRYKTGLICIKEEFDTSKPMGKAMMYIASVFAQLERETIGERVKDNMTMLAKGGRWLGGNTPLGCSSVKEQYMGENGRIKYASFLKENRDMDKVKEIYSIFLKFGNLSKTAEELNSLGIKTKNGKAFTNLSLRDILTNPVYCRADKTAMTYMLNKGITVYGEPCGSGLIAYNRNSRDNTVISVGKHNPAVSGRVWVKTQTLLEDEALKNLSRGSALASGAIKCGKCGGKMYSANRSGARGFDYICENKRKKHICSCKNLNGPRTDAELKKYLDSTDMFLMKKEIRESMEISWDGIRLKIRKPAE